MSPAPNAAKILHFHHSVIFYRYPVQPAFYTPPPPPSRRCKQLYLPYPQSPGIVSTTKPQKSYNASQLHKYLSFLRFIRIIIVFIRRSQILLEMFICMPCWHDVAFFGFRLCYWSKVGVWHCLSQLERAYHYNRWPQIYQPLLHVRAS